MDGAEDVEGAPMPPMVADNMGGDDQMADPNGMGDMMQDPNDMGDLSQGQDMSNSDDDELMDILNSLSIEDKAAVTKYAKSMADDSKGGDEMPQDNGEMPMESRKSMKTIIDEVLNDVVNDRKSMKRQNKDLPKEYRNAEMPFKSPF